MSTRASCARWELQVKYQAARNPEATHTSAIPRRADRRGYISKRTWGVTSHAITAVTIIGPRGNTNQDPTATSTPEMAISEFCSVLGGGWAGGFSLPVSDSKPMTEAYRPAGPLVGGIGGRIAGDVHVHLKGIA
jgi:hypothetical protein